MCVCVCFGDPCAQFFFGLRDYFERFLCWLDHWLCCMLDCIHIYVFHISKNCFEKLARHLLDTRWIDRENSCLLDSSSTPGGSIELLFLNVILCCSIPSRYLSCRRLVPRHLPRQLPRYLPIPQLLSITEGSIYSSIAILLSFLLSLSICPRLFISQTLSFSLQTCSSRILQAFSSFSLLGKLLILSH